MMIEKPLIRVTTLEKFRRVMSWSYEYETEQDLIDTITQDFRGNEYTRIGTAFHRIIEEGAPVCEKIPAGTRSFLHYGKMVDEPVPGGRAFDVDGHKVCFDVQQCKMALAYRDEHPDAWHEMRLYKDYGRAVVTGCADTVDGVELHDTKMKFSAPKDSDYMDSVQWRFYLELFQMDVFHFDLFVFEGYKKEKHGYDVRGLPLKRYEPPITCYRYDDMERDNLLLVNQFMDWAEAKGMVKYLINKNIDA